VLDRDVGGHEPRAAAAGAQLGSGPLPRLLAPAGDDHGAALGHDEVRHRPAYPGRAAGDDHDLR
jgi:hypothetical protein